MIESFKYWTTIWLYDLYKWSIKTVNNIISTTIITFFMIIWGDWKVELTNDTDRFVYNGSMYSFRIGRHRISVII